MKRDITSPRETSREKEVHPGSAMRRHGRPPYARKSFRSASGRTASGASDAVTRSKRDRELEALKQRLAEVEETLRAIRQGQVDALVIDTDKGKQLFTLRGADKPYRRLIEDMNEGAVTVNADGTILYCNKRFAEMVNCPLQKVTGTSFRNFLARDEQPVFDAILRESGRGSNKGEFSLKKSGAVPIDVQLSLRSLHLDGLASVGIVVTDMSERKRAEGTRALLATLVEYADDAIIGKTLDCTIFSWNAGAEKMYGYTAAEMIGRSISVLIPPGHSDEVPRIMEKIKRGETVEGFETVRRRKDGSLVPVHLAISPIQDARGKVSAAVSVARDVTERQKLEQKILEVGEWEQQLAGQHLHEGLSQHLTGIAYLISSLKRKLNSRAPETTHDVERIMEVLNEALALTSSTTRGLYPVKNDPQGLMSALQELASTVRKTSNISCLFVCETPVLVSDNAKATHLYRIAYEAVLNAMQNQKPRRLWIYLQRSGDTLRLTIESRGASELRREKTQPDLSFEIMNYRARALRGSLVQLCNRRKTILSCSVPAGNLTESESHHEIQATNSR